MNHEPECPHNDSVCDCQITECSACHCPSIRAAYKRGREAAADEILKAGYQQSLNLIQAVTIARGGEQ